MVQKLIIMNIGNISVENCIHFRIEIERQGIELESGSEYSRLLVT